MSERGVYRSTEVREPCLECDGPSGVVCPRCRAPLCATHAVEPDSLCVRCAAYEFSRITSSNRRSVATGGVASGVAAVGVQALVNTGLVMVPWFYILGPIWAGIAVVTLTVPRVTKARVRKERELPRAEREACEQKFFDRNPTLRKLLRPRNP